MLRKMAHSKAKLTGKHQALDDFMEARQALLVEYIRLSTDRKVLPEPQELSDFCSQLVDYVSAAHFEIYDYVMAAYESARGSGRTLAERIYLRLKKSSVLALNFHDKYAKVDNDEVLLELDKDLSVLGEMLEERFSLEDRLVFAVSLLNHLSANEEPA
ncbi:sigma D regulator [Oceanisphaera avium]|uniref:Rsd/AlgQ family anti-sigma factor n=1 Tax=Oceanisphaera avium TaxID=1903694 RepID=A0A1Y0CXM1_9GAMM|nr:sigma D regulator [Oceanisphaera avium]ART79998.1 Rsd/AlgQ family anti-sigma factor [Oceanisphaera avium]